MESNTCDWPSGDPLMVEYHNTEWGVPVHDDAKWFEFILLDTFQTGLSWRTILHKRTHFRAAFDGFDFEKIALYNDEKISELLNNTGIIRNRLKIQAAISNARAFIKIRSEKGSFNAYIWSFVNGAPKVNHWQSTAEIPATSAESDSMSRDLKKRGFKFVGSTTCYAFMQAGGLINDHLVQCVRHNQVSGC
jgi:DNA-3-methyladenine glycosylase I